MNKLIEKLEKILDDFSWATDGESGIMDVHDAMKIYLPDLLQAVGEEITPKKYDEWKGDPLESPTLAYRKGFNECVDKARSRLKEIIKSCSDKKGLGK